MDLCHKPKTMVIVLVSGILALWVPVPETSAAILNYTVSYDGTTTTMTNLPESEFPLTLMPLEGPQTGLWFLIDPGNFASYTSGMAPSGGAYPTGSCPGGSLIAKTGPKAEPTVQKLHCNVPIVYYIDHSVFPKNVGNIDAACLSVTFPAGHHIDYWGGDGDLKNYPNPNAYPSQLWADPSTHVVVNPPALPTLLNEKGWGDVGFSQLIAGTITVYNPSHEERAPFFTDQVAVGVPEPATLGLLALGGLGALLRHRKSMA